MFRHVVNKLWYWLKIITWPIRFVYHNTCRNRLYKDILMHVIPSVLMLLQEKRCVFLPPIAMVPIEGRYLEIDEVKANARDAHWGILALPTFVGVRVPCLLLNRVSWPIRVDTWSRHTVGTSGSDWKLVFYVFLKFISKEHRFQNISIFSDKKNRHFCSVILVKMLRRF